MATSALAVHVRGFDASLVGEDELREHFESVGLVDSVKIFRGTPAPGGSHLREHWDRARVTYFTEFTATRAVAQLNESTLCTLSQGLYTLRVTPWAESSSGGGGGSSGGSSSGTPAVDSTSLKLFVSWKSDFEWTWEDLRTFLGRHGVIKSITFGPRSWCKGARATFAYVWLTDVDAELTSIVQASVEQNESQVLERDGWTLYVSQFKEPTAPIKWHLSTPSDVGSAAAALSALSVGDAPLLQPPDGLDDKSPTVLMASLLGQPKHSGTALVTDILAGAYKHPELGENARSVVKSAGGGKKFFLSQPTVFTVSDGVAPGSEVVTLTGRGWNYVRAITTVTPLGDGGGAATAAGLAAAAGSAAAARRRRRAAAPAAPPAALPPRAPPPSPPPASRRGALST